MAKTPTLSRGSEIKVQNVFSIGPREGISDHLFGKFHQNGGFSHQNGLFPGIHQTGFSGIYKGVSAGNSRKVNNSHKIPSDTEIHPGSM